ncbi:hypothetical protein BH11MYX1_BH11MYX1_53200 [soil metagenome]
MNIALTFNEMRTASEAHAEFDTPATIAALAKALRRLGHTVHPIEVSRPVDEVIVELRAVAPELVLNLAEGDRGRFREAFYPALFEQLGLPCTGSSASVLAMCLDKALAKRIVAAAGVAVARDAFVTTPGYCTNLDLPMIVKPNFEGSSKGLHVVTTREGVTTAIGRVLARYPEGALVEEYVEGSDVAVGWVAGLGLLAPVRYAYARTGAHPVFDRSAKQLGISRIELPDLSPPTAGALREAAARSFAALGVTGYGRADFRITPAGKIIFLEMNPLPTLAEPDNELYAAAGRLGKSRDQLLAAILHNHWRPHAPRA